MPPVCQIGTARQAGQIGQPGHLIKQEIFKSFQATTVTNRFNIILLSLPH